MELDFVLPVYIYKDTVQILKTELKHVRVWLTLRVCVRVLHSWPRMWGMQALMKSWRLV